MADNNDPTIPDLVSDFKLGDRVLVRYLELEALGMASHGYSEDETFEAWRQRAITIIYNVSMRANLVPFIPYMAMNYYDRFVSGERGPLPGILKYKQHDLEFLCIGCLTLACRVSNSRFSVPNFLRNFYLRAITPRQVRSLEDIILNGINWHDRPVTPLCFIRFFEPELDAEFGFRLKTITQIIVNSQNDFCNTRFRPSVMAASALLAASSFLYPEKFRSFVNVLASKKIFADGDILKCTRGLINMCKELRLPIESRVGENGVMPLKKVRAEHGETSRGNVELYLEKGGEDDVELEDEDDPKEEDTNEAEASSCGGSGGDDDDDASTRRPEKEILTAEEEAEEERLRFERELEDDVELEVEDDPKEEDTNEAEASSCGGSGGDDDDDALTRRPEKEILTAEEEAEEERLRFERELFKDEKWRRKGKWKVDKEVEMMVPRMMRGDEGEVVQFGFLLRWKIGMDNAVGFRIFSKVPKSRWAGPFHAFCNYCCCYCCPPGCNPF